MKLEPLAKFTGKGLPTVWDWVEETDISSMKGNSAPKIAVITKSSIVLTEEIQLWKEVQTKDPAIQATLQ